MVMNKVIRQVFKQTLKNEIIVLLSQWGKIPVHKVDLKLTKQAIAAQVYNIAKECNLKDDDVLLLQLLCLMQYPSKRVWRAYKMHNATGSGLSDEHFEPNSFQATLRQRLIMQQSYSVYVKKARGALWGILSTQDAKQQICFIHFPFSSIVLVAGSSQKLTSTLIKEIRAIVGFEAAKSLDLESNDPYALSQILLRNENDKVDATMAERIDRPDPRPLREFCDKRVNICHKRELKRSREMMERRFGRKLQPRLQHLDISTDTKFKGRRYIRDMPINTRIQCQTRLVGPNVLEGLRRLAEHDLVHHPLPTFLTRAGTTGRQCLKITDKQNDASRLSA